MNLSLKQKIAGVVMAVLALFGLSQAPNIVGSSVVGNDYQATSTKSFAGVALANLKVLKTGDGTLARLTITGAGAGTINFFDATTSAITQRAASKASSSILIASFPVSAAANTYDFDAEFKDGLLYEIIGTAPTSTIIWR